MWTPADRALVGDFGSGQALTDDQFRLLEPLIPPAKSGGRPRSTDLRRVLDGLFYLVRTGCQWRHLPPPPAFPPWRTVYGYMRAFLRDGVWESIRHHFVVLLREGAGREASPTAAIVDTQSVKTTESGGPRGWDAAKRLKGRKRHVAVDTDGLLLGILVHAADIQDAGGLGGCCRRRRQTGAARPARRARCWHSERESGAAESVAGLLAVTPPISFCLRFCAPSALRWKRLLRSLPTVPHPTQIYRCAF